MLIKKQTKKKKKDEKMFHFKNEYWLSGATFYDCISTIHQFIKPFLDNNMSVFEEYGAFKVFSQTPHFSIC